MSIEMLDKNATLKQRTEQRLTSKHCIHAEISPQHTQNLSLLAKSNQAYVLSLFVCYKQDFLEKMQIIWGRATASLMFEGKSNKLKIGAK